MSNESTPLAGLLNCQKWLGLRQLSAIPSCSDSVMGPGQMDEALRRQLIALGHSLHSSSGAHAVDSSGILWFTATVQDAHKEAFNTWPLT